MPPASRWLFSPISSAIIDLPLVTVRAPAARQIDRMISRASSAVRAKCTSPPDAVTFASYSSR